MTEAAVQNTEQYGIQRGLRSRKFRAEELGLCEATLARAMKRGELSFCRVGDRILISDSYVEQWLASVERSARTDGRVS